MNGMMYSYPKIFDDIISKVKVDIKGSDPLPKIMQILDEKEKNINEDFGSKTEKTNRD